LKAISCSAKSLLVIASLQAVKKRVNREKIDKYQIHFWCAKMTTNLQAMESEWLVKLAQMRESIAKLNLSDNGSASPTYGSDLGLNDDEFLYGSGSDDIWGLISDDAGESNDENSFQKNNGASVAVGPPADRVFDQEWLSTQCAMVASKASGLETEFLRDQIIAILASDSSGMDI
jgi:hypothetical protein